MWMEEKGLERLFLHLDHAKGISAVRGERDVVLGLVASQESLKSCSYNMSQGAKASLENTKKGAKCSLG